ncbi:alkyl sulfatase dimerization domain-containing protein [Neobacillus drentensis]|uniref:alkyl sulfatase dimerization domain-containing protein n=1 Tax=Neobacillus drentensis TaxID=220684 RepID=UPI0030017C2E
MNIQELRKSPYLGAEVEIAQLPNGAKLNKNLAYAGSKEQQIIPITNGVTALVNFSVENTVIIEGNEGVIIWDTGSYTSVGKRKYEALRQISDKPVKAIIYSHNHYAMGTTAFVGDGKGVEIISHPDLHRNVTQGMTELGPSLLRNGGQHFGYYLPRTGPDAGLAAVENVLDTDKSSGYIQPTYGVKDGEEMIIDGVRIQFYHTPADTNDSLTIWLPDHDVVVTNSIWHLYPNLYTLRGQPYRNPVEWINGIDMIRSKNPQYLVPEHGMPMLTREKSYELATYYRDGIAFVYSQTIRGINKGMKPDDIADSIELPEHLANFPQLKEAYGELKHHVKGIYSGLIGWFSLDAADINPVPISFRSKRIVEGFGGPEFVIDASNQAFENKEYAWAAELITHLINIEPTNSQAKQIKANALRQMGYVTPAVSSRAFYLTQALVLEGKVDLNYIPPGFPGTLDEKEMRKHVDKSIKLLEFKINPNNSKEIDQILSISTTDLNQEFGLHIRKGLAEFINQKPNRADLRIELPSEILSDIIFGKITIEAAFESGKVKTNDDVKEIAAFFSVFE